MAMPTAREIERGKQYLIQYREHQDDEWFTFVALSGYGYVRVAAEFDHDVAADGPLVDTWARLVNVTDGRFDVERTHTPRAVFADVLRTMRE